EEVLIPGDKGDIRVRRWNALHFAAARHTILDVLRLDDPAYQRPLVVGTTARELTTAEFLRAYPHRWPVAGSQRWCFRPLIGAPIAPSRTRSCFAWAASHRQRRSASASFG